MALLCLDCILLFGLVTGVLRYGLASVDCAQLSGFHLKAGKESSFPEVVTQIEIQDDV
jgi:hypothetical protein